MFTKIVVGIDGLDGGRDATALARTLAADDAEVVLVHAYPRDALRPPVAEVDYDRALHEQAEALLSESQPADLRARSVAVADTSPGRAIHRTAEAEGADLMVIGCSRRGAVGRVLIGDVSRSTLHGANCPVAVAPHDYAADPKAIGTIGVGFADTEEARAALALAARLAGKSGARLRVMTAVSTPVTIAPAYADVYDPAAVRARDRLEAEQQLTAAIEALPVPAAVEVVDSAPGEALAGLSAHVDLMVTGSRGWGAARRVVLGSTSDWLVHHAQCPVLVVPSPV